MFYIFIYILISIRIILSFFSEKKNCSLMILIFNFENDSSDLIYLGRIKNKQEILSSDKNFSKNV